jgi:heat-inducible transcriptional repressor
MSADQLTEREESVLGAVIRAYVETAEPAGSRNVADRFALGISPATVRNTMAELEAKGYLFHPHTSAGRVPTDRAYRYFVDTLMGPVRLTAPDQRRLRRELGEADGAPALERLIQRAAQVLGLLTGELGMALVPRLDEAVLEKLELVAASSEKVLLVLTLKSGVVRMVYVDLPMSVPAEALIPVALVLNERLAGRTLREIRRTLPERLRDAAPGGDTAAVELLDIFVEAADELFDAPEIAGSDVVLGRTSVLASQPEFASGSRLKSLIELTEERELLAEVLGARAHETPFTITIGGEHAQAALSDFTLVTAEYRIGNLAGVLGVIGPTRMRYERVAALVDRSGALLTELLGEPVSTTKRESPARLA